MNTDVDYNKDCVSPLTDVIGNVTLSDPPGHGPFVGCGFFLYLIRRYMCHPGWIAMRKSSV